MSGLDGALLLVAVCMGACWFSLAAFLLGSRFLFDLRLGSFRTAPEAWPVRSGEAVPKRALPATVTAAEVGMLAAPARPAPVAPRGPVLPRRTPVAPAVPVRPAPTPAPALTPLPAVGRPKRVRPARPEPVPVSAGDEAGTHVAA